MHDQTNPLHLFSVTFRICEHGAIWRWMNWQRWATSPDVAQTAVKIAAAGEWPDAQVEIVSCEDDASPGLTPEKAYAVALERARFLAYCDAIGRVVGHDATAAAARIACPAEYAVWCEAFRIAYGRSPS